MSGVIDLEFLRENTFSIDNMRELIEIYLTTTPMMYEDLLSAAEKNNIEKMRRTAHKLKSNMNTMGVKKGGIILDRFELTLDEHNAELLKKDLPELKQIIDLSEKELKEALNDLR